MSASVHPIGTTSSWPARRRDDTPEPHTRRSTPAFEVPVPLPAGDLPCRGPLRTTSHEELEKLAKTKVARRLDEQLQADKKHRQELRKAHDVGFVKGERQGFTGGWLWGLVCGAIASACIGVAAVKLWAWLPPLGFFTP